MVDQRDAGTPHASNRLSQFQAVWLENEPRLSGNGARDALELVQFESSTRECGDMVDTRDADTTRGCTWDYFKSGVVDFVPVTAGVPVTFPRVSAAS